MKKIPVFFLVVFFMQICTAQTIKINEFMASNSTTIMDEFGGYDDWIELYNYGNTTMDVGGYYFTDDFTDFTKYQVPLGFEVTKIPAKGYLVLWADNDSTQNGPLHLKFKLSGSGEAIGIFAPNGITPIDTITYGQQITDISYGRFPDANSSWLYFNFPTPGASNNLVGIDDFPSGVSYIKLYPNPVSENTVTLSREVSQITIFDMYGKQVALFNNSKKFNINTLNSGIYSYIINDNLQTGKLIVIH